MVENTGTTHLPCNTTVRSDLVEHATLLSDISYSLCPRGSRKYWYPTHKSPWEGTGDSEAGRSLWNQIGISQRSGQVQGVTLLRRDLDFKLSIHTFYS